MRVVFVHCSRLLAGDKQGLLMKQLRQLFFKIELELFGLLVLTMPHMGRQYSTLVSEMKWVKRASKSGQVIVTASLVVR